MGLGAAVKIDIVKQHQHHDKDTGSSEVQIALLTNRINYLTEHFDKYQWPVHF